MLEVDQLQALCERWGGHGEVINWANPEEDDSTPLHVGVQVSSIANPKSVAILLSTPGCEVNKGDKYGKTPLWWAIDYGLPKTVQALLAAPGIDLNKAPNGGYACNGKSPLTFARESAFAIAFGNRPELQDFVRQQRQEVVRLLVEAGAK